MDEDEVIAGDVVAIGGSARVNGEVRGNVVALGGGVRLGPRAHVVQDVTVIGGTLQADPAARIDGELHEISPGAFGSGAVGSVPWRWGPGPWGWTFGSAFRLMSTIVYTAVLGLLAALVVLLARDQVDRIGMRAWAEPIKAGGIGFLATLLFVPVLIVTILILVITIIGIPLLVLVPFAFLALGILALVGFTAVAQNVGRFVSTRLGWNVAGPYAVTLLGVAALLLPLLLARLVALGGGVFFPMTVGLNLVAFVVQCAAWMVGLGAVALTRFSPRPATLA